MAAACCSKLAARWFMSSEIRSNMANGDSEPKAGDNNGGSASAGFFRGKPLAERLFDPAAREMDSQHMGARALACAKPAKTLIVAPARSDVWMALMISSMLV
jgi:hypothetical protein